MSCHLTKITPCDHKRQIAFSLTHVVVVMLPGFIHYLLQLLPVVIKHHNKLIKVSIKTKIFEMLTPYFRF